MDLKNKGVEEVLRIARQLYTREGYFARFHELCLINQYSTYKSNWHLLEIEHFAVFGCYRYEDYNNFRVAKKQYQDKLKKVSLTNR